MTTFKTLISELVRFCLGGFLKKDPFNGIDEMIRERIGGGVYTLKKLNITYPQKKLPLKGTDLVETMITQGYLLYNEGGFIIVWVAYYPGAGYDYLRWVANISGDCDVVVMVRRDADHVIPSFRPDLGMKNIIFYDQLLGQSKLNFVSKKNLFL